MNKCHLNNSRITCWILSIQEYKFDIVHCKGKDNIVADLLSRNPGDATLEEINDDVCEYLINHMVIKMNKNVSKIIKDIGKYQLEDTKLKTIIDKINEGCLDKEVGKFYRYVNEKLYRQCKKEWKLYIPNSVSGEIIAEIHRMYGHLGSKKCTKMLQEHFTMDKMLKKVRNYVRASDAVSYTHLDVYKRQTQQLPQNKMLSARKKLIIFIM